MSDNRLDFDGTMEMITIEEYHHNYKEIKNLRYYSEEEIGGDEYKRERARLDVYYPVNRKNVPTVIFFHGGGFTDGEPGVPDVYKLMGCVFIAPTYRLSPKATCPAYLEDGAAAVAWAVKHAREYNGSTDNIFIGGISAGAYLTTVLCTMPRFLAKYGLSPKDFNGFLSVSGEMITHLTIRAERGIAFTQQLFDEYAPLNYASPDLPPLLMVTGQTGLEIDCRPGDNKLMRDALVFCGNQHAEYYELPGQTHCDIGIGGMMYCLLFIRKHLKCLKK